MIASAAGATAPDPFAPATLGPITLRNRIVKAATFEGMAVDNLVTDRLIYFHRTVAGGGVGMTTSHIWQCHPTGRERSPRSSYVPSTAGASGSQVA